MIYPIINRILRNRIRLISFPKLQVKKFNKFWDITIKKFVSLSIIELLPIIKCLTLKLGPASLLTIPTIFYIIKNSEILEDKESKDHLNMFKALDVDNNKLDVYFTFTLIFSLLIRIMKILVWLFWLPLKIAIFFYILDYLNYDLSYIYHKINNLSLGVLDWYYRTLIDFLESLIIKYDFYKLDHHANI